MIPAGSSPDVLTIYILLQSLVCACMWGVVPGHVSPFKQDVLFIVLLTQKNLSFVQRSVKLHCHPLHLSRAGRGGNLLQSFGAFVSRMFLQFASGFDLITFAVLPTIAIPIPLTLRPHLFPVRTGEWNVESLKLVSALLNAFT